MAAVSGIDWASEWHDVDIADEHGTRLLAARFAHDERGVCALIAALIEHRVCRVAIERPDGLLVARLLAAGINVLAIHPNQVAAARDRFRAAAGKSDPFDGFVLRELCRTDSHRFPVLAPCADETLALRALVRAREDLVGARVALANQLRAQLDAGWPGATRIFRDTDSPIALAFLARYPSHADARGLGPKRLDAFLARHAYSGRKTPEQLLARLRSAATPALGEHESDARRSAVLGLVAALTPLVAQISQLTGEIRGAIQRHPDGPIFLSFFRDPKSVVCAAGLLAEIGDNRTRYPTDDALAADGGQAPVTKQSGKHARRQLPLGLRQAPQKPHRRPGRQHPPLAPLGPRRLPTSARPRLRPPTRHPHPRPRLDAHPVALLARPHRLRPRPPPSPHTPPHYHGLTQDVSCRADARRGRRVGAAIARCQPAASAASDDSQRRSRRLLAAAGEPGAGGGRHRESGDGVGDRARARRAQDAGAAGRDQLRRAARGHRDDREPGGLRLEDHLAEGVRLCEQKRKRSASA